MPVKYFEAATVIAEIKAMSFEYKAVVSERDQDAGKDCITPLAVRDWLARLRLLEGVPFNTIVADSELLPKESIRFFYLDRAWTDALVQGALSVGTVNSGDRAQLQTLYPAICDEIDAQERLVRLPGSEALQLGQAAQITGMLLRSRAVSGWPALQVRAYRREVGNDEDIIPESNPDRLKLLRLERLAPAVLLALFDGVPEVVHIEEPRQGVQFGVKLAPQGDGNSFSATVRARDIFTAKDVEPKKNMPVSFRGGAPGVIDLKRTLDTFHNEASVHSGAEFALQMIRFPYRQVFGDPDSPNSTEKQDVFRPTAAFNLAGLFAKFKDRFP
ncbi:hypothetical protein [Bradyrhizobium sp. URHC0002]